MFEGTRESSPMDFRRRESLLSLLERAVMFAGVTGLPVKPVPTLAVDFEWVSCPVPAREDFRSGSTSLGVSNEFDVFGVTGVPDIGFVARLVEASISPSSQVAVVEFLVAPAAEIDDGMMNSGDSKTEFFESLQSSTLFSTDIFLVERSLLDIGYSSGFGLARAGTLDCTH